MQVLLLKDVDNLGLAGDVVKVANGFGRNYLIPQELAVLANKGAMKQAEAIRKVGELRRAQEKADAEAIVGQLGDALLVFARRAGDQGQLYGSITTNDISESIQEKFGLEIDRRKVALPEPIRALGEYDVTIKLMVEVSTAVKVVVINEGETYDPNAASEKEATEEVVAEVAEVVEEVVAEAEEVAEEAE